MGISLQTMTPAGCDYRVVSGTPISEKLSLPPLRTSLSEEDRPARVSPAPSTAGPGHTAVTGWPRTLQHVCPLTSLETDVGSPPLLLSQTLTQHHVSKACSGAKAS